MKRFLLAAALLAIPAGAAAADPLRSYCFDGWAGELCFDVNTFRVDASGLTIEGRWGGVGYPVTNVDHLGRGPSMYLEFFGTAAYARFLDPDTEGATFTMDAEAPVGPGEYRAIAGLDDVTAIGLGARSSTDVDVRGWDEAECSIEARAGVQLCRVVDVPEPASAWMLAVGLLGMAVVRRRRGCRPATA